MSDPLTEVATEWDEKDSSITKNAFDSDSRLKNGSALSKDIKPIREISMLFSANDDEDLLVKVDKPQKHTTAMESYVSFRVTTSTVRSDFDNSEFVVRRRYNEFLWLRQQLENDHPTCIIPPLPEKHGIGALDRFNVDFILIRRAALHQFLTRIASHPVLTFNSNFKAFLTLDAHEFQVKKKQGATFLRRVSGSIHNIGASYMLRKRPQDFEELYEYANLFGEKVTLVDRFFQRLITKQSEYGIEFYNFGSAFGAWSSSEASELSPILLSAHDAINKCEENLRDLLETADVKIALPFKEYTLYAESIKSALRRRDGIQAQYENCITELSKRKAEKDSLQTGDSSWSLSSFMSKNTADAKIEKELKIDARIEQLEKDIKEFDEKSKQADADLRDEMKRWKEIKRKDFSQLVKFIATKEVEYHKKCVDAWSHVLDEVYSNEVQQSLLPSAQQSHNNNAYAEDSPLFTMSSLTSIDENLIPSTTTTVHDVNQNEKSSQSTMTKSTTPSAVIKGDSNNIAIMNNSHRQNNSNHNVSRLPDTFPTTTTTEKTSVAKPVQSPIDAADDEIESLNHSAPTARNNSDDNYVPYNPSAAANADYSHQLLSSSSTTLTSSLSKKTNLPPLNLDEYDNDDDEL